MNSLSNRLRPKSLDDFIGQEHLLSKSAPFYKLIISKNIPHSFFFGPPGSGKTTLAKIISNYLDFPFYSLNATTIKIDDIRKIIVQYKNSFIKPLIFIDEVHRLSKNQQEVLLPIMEKNQAIIMGATTENPYFSLTSAIRSRSFIFEFKPLNKSHLKKILERAKEIIDFTISREAKDYLINSSLNDARSMLNLLEAALNVTKDIDLPTLKSLRPTSAIKGVSQKDEHYYLISALIKSIRGSDIDASLYYLARLISEGESAEFIARRLVILASEDIGNANPNALNLAVNTLVAVKNIGYPEAKIILSQAVIYLASSPKSNSAYLSIKKALKVVEDGEILEELPYLKTNSANYLNPHNFGGYVKQRYLSKPLKFYQPKGIGFEKRLNEWIDKIKSTLDKNS